MFIADLLVLVDHAVLADVDPVLEAEQVRHLPQRALAQAHGGSRSLNVIG